jgi:RNA polymerase sigma-70 factor (ECF subfamily)
MEHRVLPAILSNYELFLTFNPEKKTIAFEEMKRYESDIALFAAFHRGEEAAVRQVYQLHFKPLCFFAQRITGSREEAQDLVADSFVKMLQKREEFQNLSNVKSFLYLITKNACINHIRATQRHDAAHKQIRFLGSEGTESENVLRGEMLRLELLQAIHAEIENLPGRCKEIFKLLFIEGLGTEEIGERLGISAQTVRTQKARALQLIRSELLKKNLILALLYLSVLFPRDWL